MMWFMSVAVWAVVTSDLSPFSDGFPHLHLWKVTRALNHFKPELRRWGFQAHVDEWGGWLFLIPRFCSFSCGSDDDSRDLHMWSRCRGKDQEGDYGKRHVSQKVGFGTKGRPEFIPFHLPVGLFLLTLTIEHVLHLILFQDVIVTKMLTV